MRQSQSPTFPFELGKCECVGSISLENVVTFSHLKSVPVLQG